MVHSEEGYRWRGLVVDCEVVEGITLLLPASDEAAYHSFDVPIQQEAGLALQVKSFLLQGVLDDCQFIAMVDDGLFVIQNGYVLGGLWVEDGLLSIVLNEDAEEGFDERGGIGGGGEGERRGGGEFVAVPADELLLAQLLLLFDLPLHIYYTPKSNQKRQGEEFPFLDLPLKIVYTQKWVQTLQIMNIFNNGSQQTIQNRQGTITVSGNHNLIHIRNSTLTLSVNGNHNTFRIQNSNINLQVNGNNNRFVNNRNRLSFGLNGNNNEVFYDQATNFRCLYSNGNNNRGPNDRQREQNHNNYQQERPRNRSGQRQSRQRQNRPQNQQQVPNNQQRRQRLPPQQQMRNEQVFYPPMSGGFMNGMGMGMPFQGMGFMDQIQNSLAAMFQGHRGRPLQYQFRPNRRVFVFSNQAEQEEEEESRGLQREIYQLLPRSKHSGKETNCTICLDDIAEGHEETFLICFHAFHSNCIKDWLDRNSKCPVCQYDIKEYFSRE